MKTAPLRASASPSYCGWDPAPDLSDPPYDHTMTGLRSEADAAAVQTFRYRQSSLTSRAVPWPCMHRGPNDEASRTSLHDWTGCGGRHLSGPTGGAANGTPLKTRTSGVEPPVPAMRPASRRTGSWTAAEADTATSETIADTNASSRIMMTSAVRESTRHAATHSLPGWRIIVIAFLGLNRGGSGSPRRLKPALYVAWLQPPRRTQAAAFDLDSYTGHD